MNSAVAVFLTCLLLLLFITVQGQSAGGSSSCSCSNNFIKANRALLTKKLNFTIQAPSSFCPRQEIIMNTADGKKKCVDPKSKYGQMILRMHRTAVKAAATTAAASSQTSTQSSTQSSARTHTMPNQRL